MQENSSGVIVFRKSNGKRLYLLLHYRFRGDYWDFPRGNVKESETKKSAAIREIKEETGIFEKDLTFIEGFQENIKWYYRVTGKIIKKKVTYFLAETDNKHIKISSEHVGFKWLKFKDSLRLLKYENSKNLLLKAEHFLKKIKKSN